MNKSFTATKKPVAIEAIEWTGENLRSVQEFIEGKSVDAHSCDIQAAKWYDYVSIVKRDGLIIKTLEGQHLATVGDYIIKGVKGEFYPCKPEIFKLTYDF